MLMFVSVLAKCRGVQYFANPFSQALMGLAAASKNRLVGKKTYY